MADHTCVEHLTPLDLPMPRTYIRVLFVFPTASPTTELSQELQCGLEKLAKQVPWIAGNVFLTTTDQKAPLEIRYHADKTPRLQDKGQIAASYASLSSQDMPMKAIPLDVWPTLPSLLGNTPSETGDPVFAVSFFRFADQGVGLCICLHHNAVDVTGFSEVVRLWAENVVQQNQTHPSYGLQGSGDRLVQLSKALEPDLRGISSLSSKSAQRQLTTNVILCALLWTSITRVRAQRNPDLRRQTSRLVTAVNGRSRIPGNLQPMPGNQQYLGNVVLYALANFSCANLATADEDPVRSLAKICDRISESQSPATIDSRFIAETYRLVDSMEDYRSLFAGWDLFGSRDFTITSWAGLDLYGVDFGPLLGKPEFVRLPCMEVDGVAIVLPRRRNVCDERLEVMVMLRCDDMESLERDSMWQTLVGGGKSCEA
ncbi:hypothetical protein AnigIFM63604_008847 [Aspergillus niger]|uniref:Trichothecene 3-O-acetyltransferase-like N-terminal domain-containing protein n=1 Tax=Aspergillus niger TaxID=5061 RepID=A0A9W6EDD1_ASPNG|nr:hypothetical protein CBS12448_6872 [Aspergillus niger]KAI2944884.1 hypothetical protein CBS147321_4196 [Aspergillus niger]KAI2956226.1 hypothetical protein CBS147322_2690 [Aspergillus niger]KAI2966835.1 hypothetical protein CBS147324_7244 [Aspergillus niger]KAI2989542.1 hypothetical protein CBS147344_3062 [Aspergillus niger]